MGLQLYDEIAILFFNLNREVERKKVFWGSYRKELRYR